MYIVLYVLIIICLVCRFLVSKINERYKIIYSYEFFFLIFIGKLVKCIILKIL